MENLFINFIIKFKLKNDRKKPGEMENEITENNLAFNLWETCCLWTELFRDSFFILCYQCYVFELILKWFRDCLSCFYDLLTCPQG